MTKSSHNERAARDSIAACIAVLEHLVTDTAALTQLPDDQRIALLRAAGRLSRPDRDEIRKRRGDVKRARRALAKRADREARSATGIRRARDAAVFQAPIKALPSPDESSRRLDRDRECYICREMFADVHHFYDSMCPACADFNYAKRFQSASLDGQVALITGARLKIGYHAALMMLRAGAHVIVTTRFPVDAAKRYAQEADFASWGHRLDIFGLDLRHTPSVELFARHVCTHYDRLDLLINNAAQTVRRPAGFYSHLLADERAGSAGVSRSAARLLARFDTCRELLQAPANVQPGGSALTMPVGWSQNHPGVGLRQSAELSQIAYQFDGALDPAEVFPTGQLDADLQQVDLRTTNSWRLRLGEVPTVELLEVQLINAIAPFVLANQLLPLMRQQQTGCKHIVNVTAMEGKFHRFKKASRHPHTNMAKAALNMFTHTSADDLARVGIFVNAVDTGWVTDEDPADLAAFKRDNHDFQPQLDIVDGAARVCDPFFDGIRTGTHWSGKFLKDYRPIDW